MERPHHPITNRDGYDLWSPDYDAYPNPTVATDERHFPIQWSHWRGRKLLEVGCGTGRHTARLLAQGNTVTGIDLSPGMLAVARRKLAGRPVTLIEGDFVAGAPFGPQSFDGMLAALVLEHIRELPAFFAAARRVLKPAAQLHVSELHPARAALGTQAHFRRADGEEYDLESVAHAEGAIEAAAAAAGFALRTQRDARGDAALAALRPGWSKYLDRPMIRMWSWTAGPGDPSG